MIFTELVLQKKHKKQLSSVIDMVLVGRESISCTPHTFPRIGDLVW